MKIKLELDTSEFLSNKIWFKWIGICILIGVFSRLITIGEIQYWLVAFSLIILADLKLNPSKA